MLSNINSINELNMPIRSRGPAQTIDFACLQSHTLNHKPQSRAMNLEKDISARQENMRLNKRGQTERKYNSARTNINASMSMY